MIAEFIEWDDDNLDHATRRLTAAQIEQAIWNAERLIPHRVHADRGLIRAVTDGGTSVVVIVQVKDAGVRPITGWEA